MAKMDDIHEHMEVLGSDGRHLGTVDHMEGADRVKLTKNDPNSGGRHHYISMDWVDRVDQHVHLNMTCQEAMNQWQTG